MERPRAVVTGGAGGLGRAFCVEVARRGGRVVVSDLDEAGGAGTVALVREAGGDATFVRCDVREPAQIDELARAARQWLGHTDLLVNNAGVAVAGPVEEVTLEDWRWIMEINLWGVIYGCRAFVPEMKQRGRGYGVNVASAAGLVSFPEMAPYNVTKAGVVALSETMHAELRAAGVHVSVLCPTFFKTNIHVNGRGPIDDKRRALVAKLMARSRLQAPDVARIALDAVARNRLYAVPMTDGRAMWRFKRLAPAGFSRFLGSAAVRRRLDP